jgi:hypothetical protein
LEPRGGFPALCRGFVTLRSGGRLPGVATS